MAIAATSIFPTAADRTRSFTPDLMRGIFVQTSSLPDQATTQTWMNAVVASGEFTELALSNAGASDGTLLPGVAWLAPYFSSFSKVYFGTYLVPWAGGGSAYATGISNAAHRTANIDISKTIADAVVAAYPTTGTRYNWYVTYEANLNWLTLNNSDAVAPATVKASYESYLGALGTELYSRRNAEILWSPNFWTRYDLLSSAQATALSAAISDLVTAAPRVGAWHFQDFVGGSALAANAAPSPGQITYNFGTTSAINYWRLLRSITPALRDVAINAEQFLLYDNNGTPTCCIPCIAAERNARVQLYVACGCPVGVCWEFRYWYESMFG